ncbi:hypothetical protein [Bradyrhizobium cenepequi]|uniref:hypothetical protein n=1 Tax=Bradyrhizobium cenepequi TaxID=2821403 RepID=UPI001CE337A7|nr:hypothetical protein [Bradyrhizobium cenepequi]MCA6107717.1 hypothetical protein [Bradyrhizobium cenepequi]
MSEIRILPYDVRYRDESALRFAGATAMESVNKMVAALNTNGIPVIVPPTETEPDPSLGEEDQYAIQPGAYKFWLKTGGVWVFQGVYRGFNPTGPYDNDRTYSIGDVASSGGTSYVWLHDEPGSGHAPPNATYWQVLAAKGDGATVSVGTTTTGAPGSGASVTNSGTSSDAVFDFTIPAGKGYGGSSSTSLAIGTGSKTFAIGTGYAYQVGNYIRASSAANGANFMEGTVTAYSGGNITINVTKAGGSGTVADWNFAISGAPGSGDLLSTNNLSDVANAATALVNLGADARYVKKADIVGTVSQSGGVPTGAIIERGSNTNGQYVKYADGTMICWNPNASASDATDSALNVFSGASGNWTYPATFVAQPAVSGGINGVVGLGRWLTIGAGPASTQIVVWSYIQRAAGNVSAGLMAIGRWF